MHRKMNCYETLQVIEILEIYLQVLLLLLLISIVRWIFTMSDQCSRWTRLQPEVPFWLDTPWNEGPKCLPPAPGQSHKGQTRKTCPAVHPPVHSTPARWRDAACAYAHTICYGLSWELRRRSAPFFTNSVTLVPGISRSSPTGQPSPLKTCHLVFNLPTLTSLFGQSASPITSVYTRAWWHPQ